MVKLIPATCPVCGANLQLTDDSRRAHCDHCGTEVIIDIGSRLESVTSCPDCDGTGKCKPHKDEYGMTVYTCYGTGKCPACAGVGKMGEQTCGLCTGTGKCWSCNGTGKCKRCSGMGKIVT